MTAPEQIFAQALMLAGELEEREAELLKVFSRSAWNTLAGRLKEDVPAEHCREELISAGSLYALAALYEADFGPRRFVAGELTVEKGDGASIARALRNQADGMLAPFAREGFAFLGV